ncbi:hypothetical protein CDD81_1482 [Ophiocordyceps australis]|uniref:Uncharacterized protein n=1 Tax=Ophiocordyceps australis TaxID=1399860 RepID=A0A2C5Y8E3_9HYPO|nr:hypothetical protein CDD81_1482 [Ophiocordyceps australis]
MKIDALCEYARSNKAVRDFICAKTDESQGPETCLGDQYHGDATAALKALVNPPPTVDYGDIAKTFNQLCPPSSKPSSSDPAQDLQQTRIQEFNELIGQAHDCLGMTYDVFMQTMDQGMEYILQKSPDVYTLLRSFPALFNFWLLAPPPSSCLPKGPRKRVHNAGKNTDKKCTAVLQIVGKWADTLKQPPKL